MNGTGAPPRRVSRKTRERIAAALLLAPDVLGLLVFLGIPMLLGVVFGFFRVDGFGSYDFIGLANYRRMLADPLLLSSIETTMMYIVLFVPGLFMVSLALALLIRRRFPLVGLFRSALFAPNVVSLVVVGLIWKLILADGTGVASIVFRASGVTAPSWLGDPRFALGSVVVVTIWFQMGYCMLVFLSALQDIPSEYYDAAIVDGAGPWTRFWYVTWPLLKPTSFFVLLTTTVAAMTGGLDLLYVLTAGGPANSTTLVIYYVYQQAFLYGEFGYASAIGSILILVLLFGSSVLFALTKGGRFSHAE
jgi:multiple sugar transport system permease protein